MNRGKKEELKKYHAAREGLTHEEIAEVDRREQAERDLEERARGFHAQLFPEEWDWYYDSTAESKDRRRGINPMYKDYLEKTDRRRVELGFSEYADGGGSTTETLEWIRKMLAAGREDDLQKILSDRAVEDREEEACRKEAALKADIDNEIDRMLEEKTFLMAKTDSPEDLAFRILGCCMSLEASRYLGSEAMFHTQIQRLLPGLSEKEYATLHDAALERWTDTYFT